jgi:NAD-dependent SIR2 family protein deacetylase
MNYKFECPKCEQETELDMDENEIENYIPLCNKCETKMKQLVKATTVQVEDDGRRKEIKKDMC